jgi:hypothetical protein
MRFEATREELEKISKIVNRASELGALGDVTVITMFMDLEAAHCNGCPLDFDRLMEFPDGDFLHDILGIKHHMDREKGKLNDGFVPRCAKE